MQQVGSARDYFRDSDSRPLLRTDGGNWIKSKRCSPDAFIQIAMQMAYFTLYGEFAPTYEAVMTKYFFNGRT